ncbi:MAG: hypothetical protein GX642_01665 [Smithella sp.]|nr:hypothetical protein [Smithella sp.]
MKEGWHSSLDKLARVLTAILSKETGMDECEEKKLMDKVMRDPNSEFAAKERVCDKDVEEVLWKLNEEPKMANAESGKVSAVREGKSDDPGKEEIMPDIGDVSAHSASL